MASLPITLNRTRTESKRKVKLEFNATTFEELARLLGYYSPEFLQSLERAERDIKEGRVYPISSLHKLLK
ncbi:MAG: hypothetical protein AAB386_01245 [Patescibacteria group bacterium]